MEILPVPCLGMRYELFVGLDLYCCEIEKRSFLRHQIQQFLCFIRIDCDVVIYRFLVFSELNAHRGKLFLTFVEIQIRCSPLLNTRLLLYLEDLYGSFHWQFLENFVPAYWQQTYFWEYCLTQIFILRWKDLMLFFEMIYPQEMMCIDFTVH